MFSCNIEPPCSAAQCEVHIWSARSLTCRAASFRSSGKCGLPGRHDDLAAAAHCLIAGQGPESTSLILKGKAKFHTSSLNLPVKIKKDQFFSQQLFTFYYFTKLRLNLRRGDLSFCVPGECQLTVKPLSAV